MNIIAQRDICDMINLTKRTVRETILLYHIIQAVTKSELREERSTNLWQKSKI